MGGRLGQPYAWRRSSAAVAIAMTGGGPSAYLWWLMAALLPVHLVMMLMFELPDFKTVLRGCHSC